MDEIFPEATHRYYARHIYINLKNKGFRGLEMKIRFFGTMKAYTNLQFKTYLKDIGDANKITLGWLNNINVET